MIDFSRIQYVSTIYKDRGRAEETLALAIETACEGETFDLFDNGRGFVIRMFENGEFVMCV